MKNKDFLALFNKPKPVIGMLHLKGKNHDEVFNRFKEELSIYERCGIDGVIVEDYFGDYDDLVQALSYINENGIKIPYGVNCLNFDSMGFYLARKYNCDFIQLDSLIGHIKPRDEATMKAFLDLQRKDYQGCVIGGVRFKYQPVLSGNSLEYDLDEAKKRADGICVTQDATGQETSLEKIKIFREILGDFPLIVAAGVRADNIEIQMKYADAAIIGSYFKDDHKDTGDLSEKHVKEIISIMDKIRNNH